MNIAQPFIRRRVMTTLSSLAIVLFGLMAYRLLPVNDLPNVDFPTIVVSASLPGASPETMASSVATPLEKQFSTIAGLDSMTSSNIQGSTNITLQFDLTRNIDAGTLYGPHQAFTVQAHGQLVNAAAYRPLIVAYQNGSPVRIEDIGRVLDSVQNDKTAGWSNGERSVVLAVQRQPGTNTVQVVDNVMRLLPAFRAEVPAALHINT